MESAIDHTMPSGNYRLALADKKGVYYFRLQQVIRMEASNVYTTIFFEDHPPFVVSKVLSIYDDLLKPFGFLRTHRSHLINPHFIKSIETNLIIMQDASVAELSKRKKRNIIRQLQARHAALPDLSS